MMQSMLGWNQTWEETNNPLSAGSSCIPALRVGQSTVQRSLPSLGALLLLTRDPHSYFSFQIGKVDIGGGE